MAKGLIKKVAGPLVIAEGMRDANMFDVVRVSDQRLIGEIIEMHGDQASIQVYEETSGLGPGEPVESTGAPLSVELGPGLIGSIFDGIQRPLVEIMEQTGSNLTRGVEIPSLKRDSVWHFVPTVEAGIKVMGGDIIGTVQESPIVVQKIMIPNGISGTLVSISEGDYTLNDTVAVVEKEDGTKVDITMLQKWPVRVGRPYKQKLSPDMPLVTGQRVIDALFPIAKGGVAAMQKLAEQRAEILYAEIDRNKLFVGTAEKDSRSLMNITFVLKPEYQDLQDEFLKFATSQGMVGVKGHRDVGGFRASCYNAMSIEGVQALVKCMQEFEAQH